jgi:Zn-finger nucleic acid-binding protein
MKQSVIGDITVKECLDCKGMWLERGKLEDVKDEVLPGMEWLTLENWKDPSELTVHKTSLACPRCRNVTLAAIEDEEARTELDVCARCKGIWLGAGQFFYFVNALLDEVDQKTAPEMAKMSLQQAKEMLSNPDAIVSEWKDLKTVLGLLKHRIFIENPKLRSIVIGLQKSLPL